MGDSAHRAAVVRFVDQIVAELKRAGVHKEVLAMDFADPYITEAFAAKGIKTSGEGFMAMLAARKNKLPEEIECLRNTCTVGDAMFQALVETARPGASENEILGEAFKACYKNGGEVHSGVFCTSGPYTWPNLRHSTGRRLAHGDVLYMDVYNTSWNGYKTCYYRTFSVGMATQPQRDAYRRAREWMDRAIDLLKPGVSSHVVASSFPTSQEIGFATEMDAFGLNFCHGLGLGLHERPLISRLSSLEEPLELTVGMVFAVETYCPASDGFSAARIEEEVILTPAGPKVISLYPAQELPIANPY
jgi:Xaa-Pro dipeptidase